LERATTTVDVLKTLLKCQSLKDRGSLESLAFQSQGTIKTGTASEPHRRCCAWTPSTPLGHQGS